MSTGPNSKLESVAPKSDGLLELHEPSVSEQVRDLSRANQVGAEEMKKLQPQLTYDSLPSMSISGAESASKSDKSSGSSLMAFNRRSSNDQDEREEGVDEVPPIDGVLKFPPQRKGSFKDHYDEEE